MDPEIISYIHDISNRVRLVRAMRDKEGKGDDLSNIEILILEFLRDRGETNIMDIASGLPQAADSTISAHLTRLWSEKKLVTKRIDPGRQRERLVELTDAGRELIETIRGKRGEDYASMLEGLQLEPEEWKVLKKALAVISEYFARELKKPMPQSATTSLAS